MKKKKRTQKLHWSIRATTILILIPSCVFFIVFTVWWVDVISQQDQTNVIEEKIIIPVNTIHPIETQNEYSEWVTITIGGHLVDKDNQFIRDAVWESDSTEESVRYSRQFLVDGVYPFTFSVPPDYAAKHIYQFRYHVDDAPRTVEFQLFEESIENINGEFWIEISSKNKVDLGGR